MRFKVPFFGYVLAIVGLLLPSVIFVGFLPSLINTEPVKARLMEELQDWSGGDVKVAGPISIESFFSLTVDLRNVELGGVKGVANITGLKAARIIARVSWSDLLLGNLDFDKIKIYDAVISAKGGNSEEISGTLLSALAGAHFNPFGTLSISDSVILFEEEAQQRRRKVEVNAITAILRKSDGRIGVSGNVRWLGEPMVFRLTTRLPDAGRPDAPVPTTLNIDSPLLNGAFNGETSLSGALNAAGYLSLTTPDLPALAQWTGWRLGERMPAVVQLTGSLNLSPDWVSLQAAAFAVAGQKATGDLMLKFDPGATRLEGALAFDDLDLGPLWDEALGDGRPAPDAPSVSRRLMASLDLDLRVSAETLRWRHAAAKPAAFSLTMKNGALAADIAELGLFDGSILGHVDADLAREPVSARARLTAENIDTAQMLGAVSQPAWMAGRAEARLDIEAEGGVGGEQLLERAKAHARISFANGGSIPLDIPRLASSSTVQGVHGWSEFGVSPAPFDELRLQLTLEGGQLRCDDLQLRSTGELIHGSGNVDLARQQVDWRFTVRKSAASLRRGEAAAGDGSVPPEASLSIQGPWARPTIRTGDRSGALPLERTGAMRNAPGLRPARQGPTAIAGSN